MSGATKNATNSAASGSRRAVGDEVISARRTVLGGEHAGVSGTIGFTPYSVMPAHSASEDARERAYVAGIHVFCAASEDVDGRDKPGHDAISGLTWRPRSARNMIEHLQSPPPHPSPLAGEGADRARSAISPKA